MTEGKPAVIETLEKTIGKEITRFSEDQESVLLLQCKLLVVGNGEVGKTTLI